MTLLNRAALGAAIVILAGCVTVSAPPTAEPLPTEAGATVAPLPPTDVPVTEAPATDAPATDIPPTDEPPTEAPVTGAPATVAPGSTLDPSLSDAGVVGRMTLSGDQRFEGRDGTYDILGVDADGSYCSVGFDGEEYTAVAYHYAAPEGQIRHMFVVVPSSTIPAGDGESVQGIPDGRAGADFASESGFGTLYYGDATEPDEGTSTINVTRVGEGLVFEFEGVTWDNVAFSGEMRCAEG